MAEPRECGTCSLCCKLFEITELSKPFGKWCPNCNVGVGCRIYGQHPISCQTFRCGYLAALVPEEWKPSKSHMVITFVKDLEYPVVHVDPNYPGAWRKEPFHSQIRQWATDAAKVDGMVLVSINGQYTVVFPVGEQHVGVVPPGKVIATGQRATPDGIEYLAIVTDRNHG